uniref:Uncharacterized protein n=1 Tax=Lactuca sativa TaxID=4236 RepID=A0A9R1VQI3_LACSA|nr:hypothetical protein LSAT_V11C400180820 [Lactuca sativa]
MNRGKSEGSSALLPVPRLSQTTKKAEENKAHRRFAGKSMKMKGTWKTKKKVEVGLSQPAAPSKAIQYVTGGQVCPAQMIQWMILVRFQFYWKGITNSNSVGITEVDA